MSASPQVFRLPDLGEGLTEAGLVQWLVAVGDTVTTDQPIAEVETAKSIVELPTPFAGVVVARHGEPGDTIDVGAPVIEVGGIAPDPFEAHRTEEQAGSGNVLIGYGTSPGRTGGRRRPARAAASRPAPTDTAPDAARTVAVRSPIVRRLARDLGLDLHRVAATGADGAITRADVLREAVDIAVDAAAPATDPSSGEEQIDGLAVRRRTRMTPLRRAANATLTRSRAEIPEATVWVDVDATALWETRRGMATADGRMPSLTALLARFTLIALEDHPLLASRLGAGADEIAELDGVNLGIATDTPRGLMVPVIPRAHELVLGRLDQAIRDRTAAAREGTAPPADLRGSTFTLNNYGGLGVDGSAAIINHPDVAILGIGRMLERAWVIDGEITVRRIAQLSLVFDHRVCDGGYAASFLGRVCELIEHPLRAFDRI